MPPFLVAIPVRRTSPFTAIREMMFPMNETFVPLPVDPESKTDQPWVAGEGPFTLAHLAWLHLMELVPTVPYQFGPVPGIYVDEKRIRADLIAWGVIDSNPEPTIAPAVEDTLAALCGRCEWRVWGTIMLDSQKVEGVDLSTIPFHEFGLHLSVRRIPQVRFVIAVTGTAVVSATVAGGNIAFTEQWRSGDVTGQVGQMLWDICDPTGAWEPRDMTDVSVGLDVLDELTNSKDTGRSPEDEEQRTEQAREIGIRLDELGASRATVRAMKEMAELDIVARVQTCISVAHHSGEYTPLGIGGGVLFTSEGAVVSLPKYNNGSPSVEYRSGSEENMKEMVESLVNAGTEHHQFRRVASSGLQHQDVL